MKKSICLLTILFLLINVNVFSQDEEKLTGKTAKETEIKAEANFEDKNYIDALPQFKQLLVYKPKDIYYKLMTGICYSYNPDQKEKSIDLLQQVKAENPTNNIVNFYLGKAYAVNYKFDEAVKSFNMFLTMGAKEDAEEISAANMMIRNCNNAKEILADTIKENVIENVGFPVNSQYSEYVPVISADESVMIFTYRGIKSTGAIEKESEASTSYDEDVVVSYKKNGEWTEPTSIGININTKEHDAAIALSVDGQTLFIYKSDGGGDIYMSQLKGEDWSRPKKLTGDVNKNDSWEGSCSLSANGKTLYFSSDRENGFGGRDLYKATLQSDNSWGNVENLGMNINTAFNDDAPFIHPDNRTLYFSSQGHTSIGGYDIFSSNKDDYGSFSPPKNLGYPINTINDNRYFVLAADGKTGYYSGGGKGSLGEQDIYKILTGKIEKPVLALLIGKVYFNDIPTGSFMNLYRKDNAELEGTFKSNEESGKYVMALTPGSYEFEVELETGEILIDSLVIEEITDYVQLYKDFRIYSDSSLIAQNNKSLQNLLNEELDKENKTVDTLFANTSSLPTDPEELKPGKTFTLNNIFYDFAKSSLRSISIKELNHLVKILKENKTVKVEISSHTDASRNVEMATKILKRKGITYSKEAHDTYSKDYNQRLSQRRANSVVNYLVKKGIARNRFVSKGYGEEKAIASNDTEEGQQKNRRTEFKVLEN